MVDVEAEKRAIDAEISSLQKELDNNFSLSRMQIMEKKKQI